MSKKLVSIILRTKNEEFWMGRFIKGLLIQKCDFDIEIVLVDNGSTDETITRAVSGFEKTTVVRIKDYIPGAALNRGLEAAKGDFIVCISAHCVPADGHWISNLIEPLSDPDIAAVYGRQIPLPTSDPKDKRDLWLTFGLDDKVQSRDPFLHNANAAYRREDLLEHPFNEQMTNIEDRSWASDELRRGRKIYYASQSVIYHDHGIHQSGNSQRLIGVIAMMDELHNKFDQYVDYYGNNIEIASPSCCVIIPISSRYGNEDIEMLERNAVELKSRFDGWSVYVLPSNQEQNDRAKKMGFDTLSSRVTTPEEPGKPLVVDISNAVRFLTERKEYFEYVATFDIRRWVPSRTFLISALSKIQSDQADAVIASVKRPKPVFSAKDGSSFQLEYTGWLNWLGNVETTVVPVLDPNAFLLAKMDVLRKGNPLESSFAAVECDG